MPHLKIYTFIFHTNGVHEISMNSTMNPALQPQELVSHAPHAANKYIKLTITDRQTNT